MEIKPLESKRHFSAYYYIDESEIRQRESDYKEAVEALELLMEGVDGLPPLTAIAGVLTKQWDICLKVIEKAYGEKWEDIQREK